MTVRGPRYSKEEFARRGNEIYDREIKPELEATHKGKFVAIDVETGAFEIDTDLLVATDRLLERVREGRFWLRQVGYPYLHRFGPRFQPEAS